MKRERNYYVYIMTNKLNTVLYTGVTNDLFRRVIQHRNSGPSSFTGRYHVTKLVYFEATPDVHAAITREKQLKAGPRAQKVALVESMNQEWKDLTEGEIASSDSQ